MTHTRPILLFDGECNLCNGSVRLLFARDPKGNLRFANLQSETGQALLDNYSLSKEEFDSFILVEGDKVHTHSDGALRTMLYLQFPWPIVGKALSLAPVSIRDKLYNWIARNRFAWFGKTEYCQTPPQDLQANFLD